MLPHGMGPDTVVERIAPWCVFQEMSTEDAEVTDLFRDTPVRYLGYANEVGEAFRAQVHVNAVRASYGVASAYVVADAISKGKEAALKPWPSEKMRNTKVRWAVADTLVWQGLASVAIPGLTINRVCAFSGFILARTSGLSLPVRKMAVTSIGLACIPLIIKPIDWSVDYLLEHTLRRWYKADEVLEAVVHHDREVHHHGHHHEIELHHDKMTDKS